MRGLILISIFLLENTISAQSFRPSIEPYIGVDAYRLAHNEIWQAKNGVSGLIGVKALYHFGNYIAVGAGIGTRTSPYYNDLFLMSTLRVTFLKNYETGFSAYVEGGIEGSDFNASIPFYIGTNQSFGKDISLNFRLRIPTLLDVTCLDWSNRHEIGIELGLQFDIYGDCLKKPITGSGNPFILQ